MLPAEGDSGGSVKHQYVGDINDYRKYALLRALSADGVLRVFNAGSAVPADMLARLAEPFERGGAQGEGAGLGLAIAKAIASGIGGRIELVSPREGRQDGFEARFIPGK